MLLKFDWNFGLITSHKETGSNHLTSLAFGPTNDYYFVGGGQNSLPKLTMIKEIVGTTTTQQLVEHTFGPPGAFDADTIFSPLRYSAIDNTIYGCNANYFYTFPY